MRYLAIAVAAGLAAGLGFWLTDAPVQAQAGQWGDVKGQIVWGGDKAPDAAELKIDKDQTHCLKDGKIVSEEWVVNKDNKGIRWVFVWLAPEAGKEMPIHPDLKDIKNKEVTVDQPCCKFEPHALAMREGQVLIAKNTSPITHNFKYGGHPAKNPGGNPAIAAKDSHKIDNLKADDRFPVVMECTIHGWMKGYIRVFDHPYYAVTDADGKFEIKNAPAGEYRLKIWHDTGWLGGVKGRDGQKITIKAGATTDAGKIEWKDGK